jgi:hypothetical protein
MEITIKKEISFEMIENIIVTAIEGGSNYWYFLDLKKATNMPPREQNGEIVPLSIRIAQGVFNDPDFRLPVFDLESEDEDEMDELGVLSQESMRNAIGLTMNDYKNTWHNLEEEEFDAGDADVLFQLAVMGEVVFG